MASSTRSAIRTKRFFIIFGLFAVVVGAVVWRAVQPEEPPAAVSFVGYTNDATGTRVASFVVTNLKSFVVRRQAGYWIELRTAAGQTNLLGRWFSGANNLDPRGSEMIIVPVPTNQEPWRVLLPIRTDLGPVADLLDETLWLIPYKFPERKSYELRGAWIEN